MSVILVLLVLSGSELAEVGMEGHVLDVVFLEVRLVVRLQGGTVETSTVAYVLAAVTHLHYLTNKQLALTFSHQSFVQQ